MPRFPITNSRFHSTLKSVTRHRRPLDRFISHIPSTDKVSSFQSSPRATARHIRRFSSGWDGHGTDLLNDSLAHSTATGTLRIGIPKIILHAHGPSGFDVGNAIKNMDHARSTSRRSSSSSVNDDDNDDSIHDYSSSRGIVHFTGSILCFPTACFMWKNVSSPKDITVESLAPFALVEPSMEYLFLGSSVPIPPSLIQSLKQQMGKDIVLEAMDLHTAMGTFNVLNGEDRLVGAALILPPQSSSSSLLSSPPL